MPNALSVGFIMDPIETITPYKDTTLAMMLEAQDRGHTIYYLTLDDLSIDRGTAIGQCTEISVYDNNEHWFDARTTDTMPLGELDIIVMRKDPPFNTAYIFATHILDLAQKQGALVANNPQSLRDCNEKLFATHFPDCCTETIVTSNEKTLRDFIKSMGDTILKPLDGMGGTGIFRVKSDDPNIGSIIETLTQLGQEAIMAQTYLPAIKQGDKRILMINGTPIDYALARIPAEGETRGNIAAGGRGVGQPLSERDRYLAAKIGPTLKEKGLYFVGLDVIGDYITEINVTSPTCARELNAQFGLNIAGLLFDELEALL